MLDRWSSSREGCKEAGAELRRCVAFRGDEGSGMPSISVSAFCAACTHMILHLVHTGRHAGLDAFEQLEALMTTLGLNGQDCVLESYAPVAHGQSCHI